MEFSDGSDKLLFYKRSECLDEVNDFQPLKEDCLVVLYGCETWSLTLREERVGRQVGSNRRMGRA
jgi:hypothetical protein